MEKKRGYTSIWLDKMADYSEKVYSVMRENPKMKMDECFVVAAKLPAKKFYVDLSLAKRWVSIIDRGMALPLKNRNKIAMYTELHRRFDEARTQMRRNGTRIVTLLELEKIVCSEAPSFYEDVETLKCSFYKYLRIKK